MFNNNNVPSKGLDKFSFVLLFFLSASILVLVITTVVTMLSLLVGSFFVYGNARQIEKLKKLVEPDQNQQGTDVAQIFNIYNKLYEVQRTSVRHDYTGLKPEEEDIHRLSSQKSNGDIYSRIESIKKAPYLSLYQSNTDDLLDETPVVRL